ncbi:MAG: helix-turn-helix transcriptional regulator [Clostridia bacterium]
MEDNSYIKDFALRLSALRQAKNVTARDMSISLGQSHNFINNIESGKNFPTMLNFFLICEFLGVTAQEFFNYGNANSLAMSEVISNLEQLNKKQFDNIASVIKDLCK